ncbi:MAG: nuclear transport factor 2 family protein [Bacteroidota bacterium]
MTQIPSTRLLSAGLLLLLVSLLPHQLLSQDKEEEAISQVVHTLFDAMRAGDSAMASQLFHPEASMSSVGVKEGETILAEGDPARFFTAIGTPHDEVWDERIWGLSISHDGLIGSAWMNFAFFRGETYSHCGVNVFTLMKVGDSWTIISISDSRKKDCDIPEDVLAK